MVFDRFKRRHDLEKYNIHFHGLRHTFSNMLFEMNENPKIIQQLLGHRDVKTTITVYNSVNSDYVREATDCNCVIDENLHSLIMEALGIDLANNSMSSEEQIWSVAQDSENLKIKIELNFEDGVTVVHFVFDAEGNFVEHKVSITSVDGTMSYSIQMKLVK